MQNACMQAACEVLLELAQVFSFISILGRGAIPLHSLSKCHSSQKTASCLFLSLTTCYWTETLSTLGTHLWLLFLLNIPLHSLSKCRSTEKTARCFRRRMPACRRQWPMRCYCCTHPSRNIRTRKTSHGISIPFTFVTSFPHNISLRSLSKGRSTQRRQVALDAECLHAGDRGHVWC